MEGFIANSKQNDVSNKIVGIDEVERLIDDYENKNSSIPGEIGASPPTWRR